MDTVDTYFPDPVRQLDKPFSMSVEDVFTIQGRGTVVTGRIETGIVKVGERGEGRGGEEAFIPHSRVVPLLSMPAHALLKAGRQAG